MYSRIQMFIMHNTHFQNLSHVILGETRYISIFSKFRLKLFWLKTWVFIGLKQSLSQRSLLTLSAPASLSVCKFSLYYPHNISCLVMRIKQMIIHSYLSKMKNRILPNCLYRGSLGWEFGNTSYDVFGNQTVNLLFNLSKSKPHWSNNIWSYWYSKVLCCLALHCIAMDYFYIIKNKSNPLALHWSDIAMAYPDIYHSIFF